jgi:DNA-directed RNA polymerase specialized sigma24 family protein
VTPTVADQLRMIQLWLGTDEARRHAGIFARRAGIGNEADDVVAEAYLRVSDAMGRRTEPHPSMTEESHAARYAMRVLDNVCRDRRRTANRRAESPGVALENLPEETSQPTVLGLVDGPEVMEALLRKVGELAVAGFTCPGCNREVAAAMALEVVHIALSGRPVDGNGRTWLDRLLHTALLNVEGDLGRSETAQNQRKSRCGRCAVELLESAARQVTGRTP